MNGNESKGALIAPRGNSRSILSILHVFLLYRALYGEEKSKNFLEALDKDMKKDGLSLKDYINTEEPK